MILRFHVSNYRSFQTEQQLSLIASALKDEDKPVLRPKRIDEGVLPVAAIYGANASGKTNVILAMRFMCRAIVESHARWAPDEPIPVEPFASQASEPSTFSLDFLIDGIRYQYGFSLNAEAILEEWMHAYPSGKRQKWFTRKRGEPMSFGEKLLGENRTIERLTRPNSLFLSAAAQNNHDSLSVIYNWFSRVFLFVGQRSTRDRWASLFFDPKLTQELAELLSVADLGITGVTFEVDKKLGSMLGQLQLGQQATFNLTRPKIQFLHSIGESIIPFNEDQESKGTLAFLSLLVTAVRALKEGGVFFVDELDESLHPLLAIEVIRKFSDITANKQSAQLIFNTHDTNMLSAGILRRDQIWFTEKGPDGSSHLYPLTDFKPRKHESLENGYLQGRYGAIPFLDLKEFLNVSSEE
jgi:hypothetical protein